MLTMIMVAIILVLVFSDDSPRQRKPKKKE